MGTRSALDPVGRLRLPRRSTTTRLGLVAVLLLTAAGALYSVHGATPTATGARPAETPGPTPVAATVTPTTPAGARLPIPEGLVGVPVPLGSPAGLAMLRPGDRVDLLAAPEDAAPVTVAEDVPVLGVEPLDATVLLALTPGGARRVVAAPDRFAVIVRR